MTIDADLNRPYIDRVTLPCEKCDGIMRRVPDLIDVWFDSGAMPMAQYHYPFENEDVFKAHFPADFIAEGLDQTRGWFFSLLAEATMLFDESSFGNVICTNLVLDKQRRKMSKSLKNTVDPFEVMSKFGADATRWYFYAAVAVGNEYRFDLSAVQDVVRRFLLILWNTYAFFANYARLDGFELGGAAVPVHQRALLDQWLLAELEDLRKEMSRLRRVVAGGLAARNAAGIKVRQPLREVTVAEQPLVPELENILLEELNIKSARYHGGGGGITLDTRITEELKLEGLARDLVRKIQELRKQSGFAVEDRIRLFYEGDGVLAQALERWRDYIATETLAMAVAEGQAPDGASTETLKIEGHDLKVSVLRVAAR